MQQFTTMAYGSADWHCQETFYEYIVSGSHFPSDMRNMQNAISSVCARCACVCNMHVPYFMCSKLYVNCDNGKILFLSHREYNAHSQSTIVCRRAKSCAPRIFPTFHGLQILHIYGELFLHLLFIQSFALAACLPAPVAI